MFSGISAFPDNPPEPSPLPSAPAPKCFLLAFAIFNPAFLLRVNVSVACGPVGRCHCVYCDRSPGSSPLGSREIRFGELQDVLPDGWLACTHPGGRQAYQASSPICGAAVHASWAPALVPPQLPPLSSGLWAWCESCSPPPPDTFE